MVTGWGLRALPTDRTETRNKVVVWGPGTLFGQCLIQLSFSCVLPVVVVRPSDDQLI